MKAAKPADMTKAEEKYWKEAEKAVEDTYDPEGSDAQKGKYYGTVTNIFKAKVQKHLGHDPFKKKKKDDKKSKKKSSLKKDMRAAAFVRKAEDEGDPDSGEHQEWLDNLWVGPNEQSQNIHQQFSGSDKMVSMLSFDAPADSFWKGVVTGLLEEGYSRDQAVHIIQSKLSRHAIVPTAQEVLVEAGRNTAREVLSNPGNKDFIQRLFQELKTEG